MEDCLWTLINTNTNLAIADDSRWTQIPTMIDDFSSHFVRYLLVTTDLTEQIIFYNNIIL